MSDSEQKVLKFYGEYSLNHWIKLLETGNISIPSYQRKYNWTYEQAQKLINSIKDDLFIPPITIARIMDKNYILDGQQRLVSIYLSKYKKFPTQQFWQFNVTDTLPDKDFNSIDQIDFDNKYLGFSFLTFKDSNLNPSEQENYFAKIFMLLNSTGSVLQQNEILEAYYFIYSSWRFLITPPIMDNFSIKRQQGIKRKVNFIKIVGYVLQYINNNNVEDYNNTEEICELIDSITNPNSTLFNISIQDAEIRMNKIETFIRDIMSNIHSTTLGNINYSYIFDSIYECETFFSGLIYTYLIRGEIIDNQKIATLLSEIKKKADDLHRDGKSHKKPYDSQHLTDRIKQSIEIYEKHKENQVP